MLTKMKVEPDADLMTVADFRQHVACGGFSDDDGFGVAAKLVDDTTPVTEVMADDHPDLWVYPSAVAFIPEWATHIVWYNR